MTPISPKVTLYPPLREMKRETRLSLSLVGVTFKGSLSRILVKGMGVGMILIII